MFNSPLPFKHFAFLVVASETASTSGVGNGGGGIVLSDTSEFVQNLGMILSDQAKPEPAAGVADAAAAQVKNEDEMSTDSDPEASKSVEESREEPELVFSTDICTAKNHI